MPSISVVDYDPSWPEVFEQLRANVLNTLGSTAIAVEHVGSTSVPGLAAKPVVDMSIVVADDAGVAKAIELLATLGYKHLGNLGIDGREAFANPSGLPPHHLYVCPRGSVGLRNHLAFRDCMQADPAAVQEYGRLKKRLAVQFPEDIDAYVDGKTGFIVGMLAKAGMADHEVEQIARANLKDEE